MLSEKTLQNQAEPQSNAKANCKESGKQKQDKKKQDKNKKTKKQKSKKQKTTTTKLQQSNLLDRLYPLFSDL